MKLEDIHGEKEISSTGDCELLIKAECNKCDWKFLYSIDVLGETKEYYECNVKCKGFTTMIVTKSLIKTEKIINNFF